MAKDSDIQFGIKTWERHAKEFDKQMLSENKVPRNINWRPHRFCVKDVVLGLVALRYNSGSAFTEVDVCLSYDPVIFEDFSGTKVVTLFIISDAFMSGGSMEIHFTKRVEDGRVPSSINLLARRVGIRLNHVKEGVISSSEAKQLYFALTALSPQARSKAAWLHNQGLVSAERICFMVNSQIWQSEEMEMILCGAAHPESVLLGLTNSLMRQLFMADLFQASGALLGSYLSKKLLQKETVVKEGEAIDVEADEKKVRIGFDSRFYAKTYQIEEALSLPWLYDEEFEKQILSPGQQLVVMVRPRSRGHLHLFGDKDLGMAIAMSQAYPADKNKFAILYPEDFRFLDLQEQEDFVSQADRWGIQILVCPEILEVMDGNAIDKLSRSRLMRK